MMKKYFNLAILSAVALAGATGFTSCSSSDDVAAEEVNPNYNPETGEVPAQFVFNVSMGNTAVTRQTETNTQALGTNFRGIQNATILTFDQFDQGSHVTSATKNSAAVKATREYDLATILASGQISADNSRRIIELLLPSGTKNLMFYGKAIKDGTSDEQGAITFTPKENISESTCALTPRMSTEDVKNFELTQELIQTILTRVVQNGLHEEDLTDKSGAEEKTTHVDNRYKFWWPSKPQQYGSGGVPVDMTDSEICTALGISDIANLKDGDKIENYLGTYTYHLGTKEWSDYATLENPVPLEEILKRSYLNLTTITGDQKDGDGNVTARGEVRGGSAAAVLKVIQDLWTVVNRVRYATPTSEREEIAKQMGNRIHTRFATYFVATEDDSHVIKTIRFKYLNDKDVSGTKEYGLISSLAQYAAQDLGKYEPLKTVYPASTADNYTGPGAKIADFPTNFSLPMGSTQLDFVNATAKGSRDMKFVYKSADNVVGVNADGKTNPKYITYPAELAYFGNSPIRTASATMKESEYPSTVAEWDKDDNWTNWTGEEVTSATRSVAMKYDIQYGTALLETNVIYTDGKLYDNRDKLFPGEGNAEVQKGVFTLKGILIGGQPKTVGWDFTPKGNDFSYAVYDRAIVNGSGKTKDDNDNTGVVIPASGGLTKPTYTMVFDNYDSSKAVDQQNYVLVALELQNDGDDFWGHENLIRKGGTFYLIGKLDPKALQTETSSTITTADKDVTFPTSGFQALPPYDTDGKTIEAKRVFIQDFVTKARFIIGETSLQNAFITIPDLRSSEMSLGLSVDIKWENGIEFNNVILGQQ